MAVALVAFCPRYKCEKLKAAHITVFFHPITNLYNVFKRKKKNQFLQAFHC